MTYVYVVTHGDKYFGPDPSMTEDGISNIRALRSCLSSFPPPKVICGTGRRHIEVARALGLEPDEYSCLIGDPDSGEMCDDEFKVFLPGGKIVPLEKHMSPRHLAPAIEPFLRSLASGTVLCAGRPLGFIMKYAGLYSGNFQSAAVYEIEILDSIQVKELFAMGDVDPTLKG